ncbi:SRPBCC family protein [Streptomyces avicenniae]|uniref:SRPBCC family protein n=1 Tax=Streptomyces avicenniae TaxID=500153 RepID=UPI00069B4920|nr:SRPBCC family protein [Streptomyces avicenniae]
MAQIEVVRQREIPADHEDVLDALADYRDVHPKLLPEQYTDYAVEEGGDGAGTVVRLRFHATSKRVRDCVLEISEPGEGRIVETDRNSTLVTEFTVERIGDKRARVTLRTTWEGAGGIGGFFERTFAPRSLGAAHDRVLDNLAAHMAAV